MNQPQHRWLGQGVLFVEYCALLPLSAEKGTVRISPKCQLFLYNLNVDNDDVLIKRYFTFE